MFTVGRLGFVLLSFALASITKADESSFHLTDTNLSADTSLSIVPVPSAEIPAAPPVSEAKPEQAKKPELPSVNRRSVARKERTNEQDGVLRDEFKKSKVLNSASAAKQETSIMFKGRKLTDAQFHRAFNDTSPSWTIVTIAPMECVKEQTSYMSAAYTYIRDLPPRGWTVKLVKYDWDEGYTAAVARKEGSKRVLVFNFERQSECERVLANLKAAESFD